MSIQNVRISEDEGNVRLDVFLADRFPTFSRARIQKLIALRAVTINGVAAKANYKTKPGDDVGMEIPAVRPLERAAPENIPLDIIYEDSDLLVVNKQKGLVVHPAPGAETGTLVNALLAHCKDLSGIGGEARPGIVHRLDRNTTGLLVVAKNDMAHESLSRQIAARTAVRKYYALLWGRLPFKHAVIDAPIMRHPTDRKRMTVAQNEPSDHHQRWESTASKNVREAITEVRLIEHMAEFSWIEAILQTGRTHQIRVHCLFAGHSVVGDSTYGGQRKVSADLLRGAPLQNLNARLAALHGQALHAHFLSFEHPRLKERMEFHAPLPEEISELVDHLRQLDKTYEF